MISRDFKPVNKQYLALKMEENTLRRPHPMAFEGNLYVITNSNVVSAASNFVAMIKDSKRGFIIGEETGGGYNSHNGFTHVLYNLPNTRIQLEFSAVKVKHFLTNPQLNKYGVQPDFSVSTTLQDILNNKDPQIEYIFQTLLEKRE
jgi:C-terminal processing protease CtpA/Prc